jgi:hypothetical protein
LSLKVNILWLQVGVYYVERNERIFRLLAHTNVVLTLPKETLQKEVPDGFKSTYVKHSLGPYWFMSAQSENLCHIPNFSNCSACKKKKGSPHHWPPVVRDWCMVFELVHILVCIYISKLC